ncbi:unnamed protein product [Parnassius apollo]|uniref:(apollo) hypothetical protein n=1 Tax=Parnassius apollo TaxID=110799 RepID=A0A8S3XHY9_PARAO|nr:unnamed protein product [Parnassius apollo]
MSSAKSMGPGVCVLSGAGPQIGPTMHVVYPLGRGGGVKAGEGQGSWPGPEYSVFRRLPPQLHVTASAPVSQQLLTSRPSIRANETSISRCSQRRM